ncbi:hypothetical protein [Sodaliphilus sp.]|uniref:hypothetical protein n=1 Tax=Sodaliphilus sp. TaxID=2815818 RepID=UPI00388D1C71
MKKNIAKILAIVILLVLLVGFTSSFTLVKQTNRINDYTLNKELREKVEKETSGMDEMAILNYSINTAASYLSFTEKNNINEHQANCVGYAKLCSSICNYALKVNHLAGNAKPAVGYVKFNGINTCTVLKNIVPKKYKLFVSNHDFVEFHFGNQIIYADPCAYDLIGDKCITYN